MAKKMKKGIALIGAATIAVAAAGAAVYASTKLLVKTALEREQPKLMKKSGAKISGSSDCDEKFELARKETAEQLENSEHEVIKIVSHDNITLVGHYFPIENAKRLIIAFHGWRSSWLSDFSMISDFFNSTESSVLYVEQRGQNESGGEHMGFGLTERYDVKDWADWAAIRCGRLMPIYLAGISMGAATVLMASDLDFLGNVRGIVADCGFTSPEAIWEHVAKNNLHLFTVRTKLANNICKDMINVGAGDFSTVEALKHTSVPVLFIHGESDKFVPISMTYENYEACASQKRLLTVPNAGHAMSYWTDKDSYEKAVTEFFADFD